MSQMSPDMNMMIRAAEKAARSLNRDFGEVERLQVSRKGPGDFVSAADRRAEEIIYEELLKARPNYAFLMEESGKKGSENSEFRWIIDPLDGTRNFLHGLPHWSISIGLERNKDGKREIIAGIVYDPIKDEMFRAEKNKGAFLNKARLRVSSRQNMNEAVIAEGGVRHDVDMKDQFFRELQAVNEAGGSTRRFASAALDLAYVAAGRFDAYWERYLSPWDVAAGVLIVKEAAGFVCDVDNDKAYPVETGSVLAGNDHIYQELKKILRSV